MDEGSEESAILYLQHMRCAACTDCRAAQLVSNLRG